MGSNFYKHAYLIMVHKNTYVLDKMLELIDDKRNDIYIHIDKKSKDFNKENILNVVKKSKLYFLESENVNWAAYSMVNVEIRLMEKANKNQRYMYYHLLSGNDMPLVSQDVIHNEMAKDSGIEYVSIGGNTDTWSKYYYFLTETSLYRTNKIIKGISRIALVLPQKLFKVDRWKNTGYVSKWAYQWFSLTNECVEYILQNEKFIIKHFKNTHSPDETFLATMLYNSNEFNEKVRPSKRNIQFKDGKPTVLKLKDFDRLIQSGDFFARKFDENIDKEIIDKIYNYVKGSRE
ncbi:MAG: beta-1,6-N-acetylglucosaminyltransferase [Intestinibacter bartlettii]|uniref:beta-1,6-N-acetylglucosaminyltransferase n=1 Tax=Intestinibacter bartlettii TaxID=261299 RepID=UPI0039A000F7